jgi:Protein of unknown function (DUF4242)
MTMPKYVIEREMPGIGRASVEQLRVAATGSNAVVADLGPEIRWLESFVTEDKIYCIYAASSEEILHEHARCADLPANRIARVVTVVDPAWGEPIQPSAAAQKDSPRKKSSIGAVRSD